MHKGYAIITGAAGGIGQALVREFASAGYQVIGIIHATQPEPAPATQYVTCDLARTVQDERYASEIFAQIHQIVGQSSLKALINNAATQILGGVDTLSRDDWQQTLQVNLLAPFIWSQAFLPELEQAGGSIVNISSIHARLTKKKFVAYATSKAALSGMTRAMAVDLGPRVRVNAIEPAAIETEMLKAGFEDNDALYNQLRNCHPQHRVGYVEEVANLALVIVEGYIDFLHGACIGLDGGISGCLLDPAY